MVRRTFAAFCVVFLALAGTAVAARVLVIPSAVSISAHNLTFKGRVTASNAACKDGRKVTLYQHLSNGSRRVIGSFTTGSSGKWHVTVSSFAGVSMAHFYAKVKQRSEGAAGTTYICRSARSRTISP